MVVVIPEGPTGPEDLLVFRLGRRVMRRDVARLARFTDGLLAGTERLDGRRLEVLSAVVEQHCDEFSRELAFEEALLWPVLEDRAPGALPFAELREDRRALRDLADDARRATRAVVRTVADRPTTLATAEDHRRTAQLATAWRELRRRYEAFLDGTDEAVVALVTAHVPRAEWLATLEEVRRGLPDRRGAGARVVDVATPDELTVLTHQLGARPIAGWRAQGRRRRADDTLLFGPDPGARVEGS